MAVAAKKAAAQQPHAPPNNKQLEELYLLRKQEWEMTRKLALKSTWYMATLVLWADVAKKHYWEESHKPEQDWLDAIPQGGKRAIRIHREGRKCHAANSWINMADGTKKRGDELIAGDMVIAITPNLKLVPAKITAVQNNGLSRCLNLTLKSGRSITITPTHPLLKLGGWVDAQNLTVGDKIAIARQLPHISSSALTTTEAAILGYMTGDGCTRISTPTFTSADRGVAASFAAHLSNFGGELRKLKNPYGYSVLGATKLLKQHGIHNTLAVHKSVPVEVFKSAPEVKWAFLGAWFDCDGGVSKGREIHFYTSSPQLARDGQTLLTSLGITSSIRTRKIPLLRDSYTIVVGSYSDSLVLASKMPVSGRRIRQIATIIQPKCTCSEAELSRIPKGWFAYLPKGFSLKIKNALGYGLNKYDTTRDKLRRIAEFVEDERLLQLATSDVNWDTVTKIEIVENVPTIAVEVENYHNYLIDEIVTHNTMFNAARVVRLICNNPNIRIMVVTSYQRTAIDMCRLIKQQFTLNVQFRHFFPELAVDDPKFGKIDEFTHPARTSISLLDPTLFATYLGAPLISRRCDVWVADDPVDEDMVANPDIAQSTMDKFTQAIPLVDKTSDYRQMIFIGTPKSYNDPLAAICGEASSSEVKADKEAITGWEVLTRPISYVPSPDFLVGGEFAFPDENKDAVIHLPNVHSPKMIREIYDECKRNPKMGESYFFREFAMLVQAPAEQKFLPEWLNGWIDPQQVPLNTVLSAITVDSALKDEQILFHGDNMVILIGHFDQFGRLYLTDGARSRSWRTEDFRRNLLSMVDHPKNRRPENFIREKIGEGTLFPMVQGWFIDARKPIRLRPVKVIGQGKKYLRITEALQGPFMAGKVFFVRGQFPEDIHKVLVDELTHLGQWGHDDVADCLSLFFHPDVRPLPAQEAPVSPLVRMTRPMQLSTMRTTPAMVGWQAKMAAVRPKTDGSGALIDATLPIHEQVERLAAARLRFALDPDGRVTHIDPTTGEPIK